MLNTNKNIKVVFGILSIMFLSLIAYLSYFEVSYAPRLLSNPYNTRALIEERKVKKGSIFDRNGKVLAYSVKGNDDYWNVVYPDGRIFSPVVGYRSLRYGNMGLEAYYNRVLLGLGSNRPIDVLRSEILGRSKIGDNLKLTLDADLQKIAYNSLGNNRGAVVAMDPKTGAILALVSKPTFDPNTIDQDWKQLNSDPNSPLLNRALNGLYAPGSTFKIVTASAALKYVTDIKDKIYTCKGYVVVNGNKISDYQGEAHGNLNIKQAFTVSCNTTFVKIGLDVGKSNMMKMAEAFGFNRDVNFDLPVTRSTFPPFKLFSDNVELAERSIGQGEVQVTPLQMAMITSAIANNGVMMQPYLVSEVITSDGRVVQRTSPQVYLTPVTPDIAAVIKDMMISVVNSGTGTAAGINGIQVAGKTGTAQTGKKEDDAWFVGFAPAENPQIVVAVIVEHGGAGGIAAAPIARDVISAYLRR
ncbi:peptidoglycan glycosyltransferase [Caldanaerobius fijiensis DSM 17918]|uniref:Peptidoglycan glycosyltransferase n=2 Tax=Caldanaerobius TaxID=862261 RepID=A0A1M5B1D7_9THEO|nr:peptidoglycan glycosyltransferase [Caldanaerobius fijiensis DSM 17918]